ncbi:FecR family protein [Pseudomonas putida]|uniref:FecR family protein n=1 Tax=Pseudomonas putida TaxID=303 RepID=UPI0021F8BAB6|nr:FecR family protein [Pseudomonas putida]
MSPDQNPQALIDKAAHEWVVRLTSGDASPDDIAAAREWCAQHPAHHAAFVAARRLWHLSGHLPKPARIRRRNKGVRWGVAAMLLLGLGLSTARYNDWDADYRTAIGEQKWVELADGSRITLDADSALDVQWLATGRQITLRKGTALFDVAHDPSRPFRVEAGDLSATALGTVYSVSRRSDTSEVTVAQGRVAVAGPGATATLQAGEQVAWTHRQLSAVHSIDPQRELAWQKGRLVFDNMPLGDVLAQLQHYRPGYVLLGDAALHTLTVSGTLRLDRLDEGIDTLAQAFGLKSQRYTHYLLVLTRQQ